MKSLVLVLAVVCAVLMSGSLGAKYVLNSQQGIIQLEPKNTVNLRGPVNSVSVTKTILSLAELDVLRGSENYPIYLVLDTGGGSIKAGLDLIEYAKNIKNLKTISIFAASMGSAIVEQLPGERLVTESGTLMFHRASGSFEGQFNDGEVESQLAFWKSLVSSLEQKNADRMGMDIKVYKEKSRDELWIYGKDNVTQGAADRVVSLRCSKELLKQNEIAIIDVLFFTLKATYSKCPLLTEPLKVEEGE